MRHYPIDYYPSHVIDVRNMCEMFIKFNQTSLGVTAIHKPIPQERSRLWFIG